jgi:recombination protein RecT
MGVPKDSPIVGRFNRALLDAVNRNPGLLDMDRGALFTAIKTAAYMGLMPDGREGAIVPQKGKPTFQPMVFGLRKIAAKHGFALESVIVYANDKFRVIQGDDAKIIHEPTPLGQPKGEAIGAYAIATDREGRKYREVMDMVELNRIRSLSRATGNDSPWAVHTDEMHRKTPVKRLWKSLPMHDLTEGEVAAFTAGDEDYATVRQVATVSSIAQAVNQAALGRDEPESDTSESPTGDDPF